MIKTQREYLHAQDTVQKIEEEIESERQHWISTGLSAPEAERMLEPLRLRVGELRDEVNLYERIQAGDLSMFRSYQDCGKALIAARIAQGMTQRELAERLNVHESQISRDERNEYEGVGTERLGQLFAALSLDFRGEFRLANAALQRN